MTTILERALSAAGLSARRVEPAPSNANHVWIGDDFVLRVNASDEIGRLARDAAVSRSLPDTIRRAEILDLGREDDFEWMVVRRMAGEVLARMWPDLTVPDRRRAIASLAAIFRSLHAEPGTDAPGLWPPHTMPLEPLLELLADVGPAGEPALMRDVEAFVRDRFDAFDEAGVGLVHGDPHFENMLWDGEAIMLLDFEHSHRAYVEYDLETVLSFCDHPWFFVEGDYEDRALAADYRDVPDWFRADYPEWFAHPRVDDRLAILHISRTLSLLDEFPPGGPRRPDDPRDRRNHLLRAIRSSP